MPAGTRRHTLLVPDCDDARRPPGSQSDVDEVPVEPFTRIGEPRLRPGLAAYSFRNFFKTSRGKANTKNPDKRPAPKRANRQTDPSHRTT